MALGSSQYLKELHSRHRDWFSENRQARFASMKGADWGELRSVRDLGVALLGYHHSGCRWRIQVLSSLAVTSLVALDFKKTNLR